MERRPDCGCIGNRRVHRDSSPSSLSPTTTTCARSSSLFLLFFLLVNCCIHVQTSSELNPGIAFHQENGEPFPPIRRTLFSALSADMTRGTSRWRVCEGRALVSPNGRQCDPRVESLMLIHFFVVYSGIRRPFCSCCCLNVAAREERSPEVPGSGRELLLVNC